MGVYVGKEKATPIRDIAIRDKANNPPIPWPKNDDVGKTLVVKENLGYDLVKSSGGVAIMTLSEDISYDLEQLIYEIAYNIINSADDTELYKPIFESINITDNISSEDKEIIKNVCTNIYSGTMTLIKGPMGIATPTQCTLDEDSGECSVTFIIYMPITHDNSIYNMRVTITLNIEENIKGSNINLATSNDDDNVFCNISVECVGVSENVQPIPPNID